MTHLINNIYAVEVPEGGENIRVSQLIGTPKLFADLPGYLYAANLPPGNWQLICTTKECTEEVARTIAQPFATNMSGSYRNHEWPQGPNYYSSAVASVRSLVRSKGLDPDKTLLIKKQ